MCKLQAQVLGNLSKETLERDVTNQGTRQMRAGRRGGVGPREILRGYGGWVGRRLLFSRDWEMKQVLFPLLSQKGKPGHREGKSIPRGHTASKHQSWDLNPGSYALPHFEGKCGGIKGDMQVGATL